jgi:hypothetical protein
MRLNASRPLFDLITQGTIPTDGSEERAIIGQDAASGRFYVNPRVEKSMSEYVHDDFAGFQSGRTATAEMRPGYRLRKVQRDEPGQSGTQ